MNQVWIVYKVFVFLSDTASVVSQMGIKDFGHVFKCGFIQSTSNTHQPECSFDVTVMDCLGVFISPEKAKNDIRLVLQSRKLQHIALALQGCFDHGLMMPEEDRVRHEFGARG